MSWLFPRFGNSDYRYAFEVFFGGVGRGRVAGSLGAGLIHRRQDSRMSLGLVRCWGSRNLEVQRSSYVISPALIVNLVN